MTASMELLVSMKDVFCRARSVPLALEEMVSADLDRLEKRDIITKLDSDCRMITLSSTCRAEICAMSMLCRNYASDKVRKMEIRSRLQRSSIAWSSIVSSWIRMKLRWS